MRDSLCRPQIFPSERNKYATGGGPLNEIEAYSIYVSIKQHFSILNDYNVGVYGLFNQQYMLPETYEKRNDKLFFRDAAKQFGTKHEYVMFLAANFIYDDQTYIGDVLKCEQAKKNHSRMMMVCQSLDHYVIDDFKRCFHECDNSLKKMLYNQFDLPYTMKAMMTRDVNPESIIVFDTIFSIVNRVTSSLGENHILWSILRNRLMSFGHFVGLACPSFDQKIAIINDQLLEHVMIHKTAIKEYNRKQNNGRHCKTEEEVSADIQEGC